MVLHKSDLRIEICRSTGPGGQNVNKRETAVRIVHLPTGLAVECQEEREQEANRERAMNRLAALIYQKRIDEQNAQQSSSRKIQSGSSARSDKIRTYNFPQNRLTDHRINQNFHNILEIMKGLEPLKELLDQISREYKREAITDLILASQNQGTSKWIVNYSLYIMVLAWFWN